jgi:hypothetical protein
MLLNVSSAGWAHPKVNFAATPSGSARSRSRRICSQCNVPVGPNHCRESIVEGLQRASGDLAVALAAEVERPKTGWPSVMTTRQRT